MLFNSGCIVLRLCDCELTATQLNLTSVFGKGATQNYGGVIFMA